MVPLGTPLQNAQTVEIIAAKQGGPSRDWLNLQHGCLHSARARQKVRAWFNAIELQENIATGRTIVEKILQREGKTSFSLDELASKLGLKSPDELFVVVAKEELNVRHIEYAVRDMPVKLAEPVLSTGIRYAKKRSSVKRGNMLTGGGVLVAGTSALMTQFARCCRPAPPDAIAGFVTRGKGISIHRDGCRSFLRLAAHAPEHVVQANWAGESLESKAGTNAQAPGIVYPVDLSLEVIDRQGLLHDISEVFSREKVNMTDVRTTSRRDYAIMHFTVEVPSVLCVQRAIILLGKIAGVLHAERKR